MIDITEVKASGRKDTREEDVMANGRNVDKTKERNKKEGNKTKEKRKEIKP